MTPYFRCMQLHFETIGEGKPAYVFLHGLLGSLDNWRTTAKQLDLPGRFYLVDARNHGRSPHAPEHTYPAMARDVIELLNSEGVAAAHLLGHSMGGKTAMQVAFTAPQRVASLVVIDIAPRAYEGGHEAILQALASADLRVSRREAVEAQLAHSIPDEGIRQFLLKSLARTPEGHFVWRFNLPVLIDSYKAILAAVSGPPYPGPTLFLRGENSPYLRPEDAELIQRLFPHAQIHPIPRAGHWVQVDNPAAVREALRAFWGAQLSNGKSTPQGA